jgi:hypothetical protein
VVAVAVTALLCALAQGSDRSPGLETIAPIWLDANAQPKLPHWCDKARVVVSAEFASRKTRPAFMAYPQVSKDMGPSHVAQAIKHSDEVGPRTAGLAPKDLKVLKGTDQREYFWPSCCKMNSGRKMCRIGVVGSFVWGPRSGPFLQPDYSALVGSQAFSDQNPGGNILRCRIKDAIF